MLSSTKSAAPQQQPSPDNLAASIQTSRKAEEAEPKVDVERKSKAEDVTIDLTDSSPPENGSSSSYTPQLKLRRKRTDREEERIIKKPYKPT